MSTPGGAGAEDGTAHGGSGAASAGAADAPLAPELTRRRPLPHAALAALAQRLLPGGRAVDVRRLAGGQTTLMHRVVLRGDGGQRTVVLRRNLPELHGHGTDAVLLEQRVLGVLADVGAPVPAVLDADPEGERYGLPALVLEHVAGTPVLAPRDAAAWVTGLADALAAIHAVGATAWPDAPAEVPAARFLRWHVAERAEREGPSALDLGRLPALLADPPAGWDARRCVVHGDFHPGNVLWHRGRVAGVVDWTLAGVGHPLTDVAYCRVDLSLLGGVELGDAFVRAYLARTGSDADLLGWFTALAAASALPEPSWWLPGYHRLGRRDLTPEVLRRRLQAVLDQLQRLNP